MDEAVRELHRDLARKFLLHGAKVQRIWRSLNADQRKKIMRSGSHKGEVLEHAEDTRLENVYKFIPEWNIRDITPSPYFFLDLLKFRATTSLQDQYTTGMKDRLGDHAHIVDMMKRESLKHVDAAKFKDCYTLFLTEDGYGESVEIMAEKRDEILANMKKAIDAQLIVPQATGELVLMRQINLLQLLNIIVEDILNTSSTRTQTQQPTKSVSDAAAALAKLSVHSPPKSLNLSDIIELSMDRKAALEDYIQLISLEPTVLAHEVNLCFFTRPELIPDEKGRTLPVHTDKYISGAVFDAVHGAVKTATMWNYITRLVLLLKDTTDNQFRAIVLKELSNTLHLEYLRAQTRFKQSVAVGMGGTKWFKRMSTVQKGQAPRVSLKRNPEILITQDPQLHYILRLCQDETNWSGATQWLQKLEGLHRAHPLEQDKLSEHEFETLGDLAIIITFIQSLSSIEQMPVANHKKSQPFVGGYAALGNEVTQLKEGLDLGNFVIPIDNLLEPGMAEGALTTLDRYINEKTGTKLGFLYQDLVEDCVTNLHQQQEKQKAKTGAAKAEYITPTAPETPESQVQQRREKEKTRPASSLVYEITPNTDPEPSEIEQSAGSKQTFDVKAATAEVFSSLLSHSSTARAPVKWDAFTAAMTDLGFSLIPKYGSVYTFCPPTSMEVQKSLTLHRPHGQNIERWRLLMCARRLRRVYGWDESTFAVPK
jgi:hypothetical protein